MSTGLPKGLVHFFQRFHTLIFFLLVSIGMFIAIAYVLDTLSITTQAPLDSTQGISSAFDEETIKRIENVTQTKSKPGSRPSPFVE